ncbi:phage minor capsid protein [Aerococcaceae bacterium zg-ZJ1578]|uniref:phage minor capsid protein n=1 Tax=Aerococcaceae bacterium zg-252 TaxID=2796928 RepID=UPI001A1D42FF|nr:phage minor capsid protein [Aerococcaceae bacterium zg-1578]
MKWDFIQNDEQLDAFVNQIADVYHQLTLDLFDEIIKKLKARGTANLNKTPYIWQLEKLNALHLLNEANVKLIVRASGIAEAKFRKIIADEGYKIYKDTKQQLLEDMGRDGTNVDNYEVQRALQALASQSFREVDNLINTSLPQASRAMYQDIVTQSVASVVTGTKSAEQAVSEATMSMFKRGFSGFTDRGGKRWKADVYARNMIKSTVYRTYREMREKPAEEVGIDTFYYSVKASAREMCAPLQGKIVTKGLARMEAGERLLSLLDYGYGEPGGCLGINCGHVMTPFIPGVNYKPELPDELKNLTEEQAIQNANVEAKQRALERQIRYNKELLHVAEQLGDKGLIQQYKLNDIKLRGALDSWIKKHDFLRYDMERAKFRKSPDTEKLKESIDKKLRKEYSQTKEILGNRAPKTYQDFKNMDKEEKRILKNDKRIVEYFKGETREKLTEKQKEQAIQAYFNFKKDGIIFVDHGIARYVERMRKKDGTLLYNYDTVKNIMNKQPNYISSDAKRLVYYYDSIAIITEKDGTVVTMMRRKKLGKRFEPL